ncbi:HAD family hydrolase [Sphingomonas sp.]|uniref:HAD family hydrolase n=1 Tax=Sphingomonas sp. TaxID=28214 RepID=UPI002C628C7E|nr:HAD family hydrolase [Sphingomonas sp.]HWK34834.1 HAD family hydrolase [Sphingomonas sp.]
MNRPLLITDCDEVLLHMVRHFGVWLREHHDIAFDAGEGRFAMARPDGNEVPDAEKWALLNGFFPAEMARQTLVPHAREALERLGRDADIVVLTNLGDHCRDARIAQLAEHGIAHRVETNQGGKGDPVARLVAEYAPSVTVFVDDLHVHHESVARHSPGVHRLHMVSEPELAPRVSPAAHAHARIDDWRDAADWIAARFAAGLPAPDSTPTEGTRP